MPECKKYISQANLDVLSFADPKVHFGLFQKD